MTKTRRKMAVATPDEIKDLGYITSDGDLTPVVKDCIGKYVVAQAAGDIDPRTRSRFVPVPESNDEFTLSEPDGDAAFGDIPDGSFASGADLSAHGESRFFREALRERSFIRKGGKTPPIAPSLDGHGLLRTTAADDVGAAFYSNFLMKNNRFNTDTTPTTNVLQASARRPSIQSVPGKYDRTSPQITSTQLARVGQLLSLRSTGEFFANGPIDPNDPLVQLSALLPGEAQIINPLGIDPSRTSAGQALRDSLVSDGVDQFVASNAFISRLAADDDAGNTDGRYAGRTVGNMNNFAEHFSGLLPLGTAALAVALSIATFIGMQAVILILGGFATPVRLSRETDGTFTLGKHVKAFKDEGGGISGFVSDVNSEIGKFLGLAQVAFQYGDCVEKGFEVFFGLDDSFGNALQRVAIEQPGYYATFSRMLTRSIATVSDAISVATESSSGPLDIINSITGIVDAIRQSKIIKVINFFADLGNKRLIIESDGIEGKRHTGIDRIAIEPNMPAVAKDREFGSRRLAWRSGGTPSMLTAFAPLLRQPMPQAGGAHRHSILKSPDVIPGAISEEMRRELEQRLDAEYAPFYFHDVRTNEIVSFHAFLSEFSESYEPQYNDNETFGRIDSIMTYKRTARRISVAFMAVSTNPDDFDQMWVKINKLTTLIYPKWTRGRRAIIPRDKLSALGLAGEEQQDDLSFTQPFSQLIGDSPLVRLRIGDVVRSNYSRFALARLFGYGDAPPGTDPENAASAVASDTKRALEVADAYKRRLLNRIFARDDIVMIRATSDPASSAFNTGYAPLEQPPGFLDQMVSVFLPDTSTRFPLRNTRPVAARVIDTAVSSNRLIVDLVDSPGLTYVVNVDDVYIGASLIDEAMTKMKPEFIESDFLGTKNPVFRSFEQSGGKGLAGFITSLSFDWKDMPWETTRYGARAPMICPVKLSFTAIHDIAPGIDHNGFNRAPIYNVGSAMNGICGDADDITSIGRDRFDQASKALNSLKRKI